MNNLIQDLFKKSNDPIKVTKASMFIVFLGVICVISLFIPQIQNFRDIFLALGVFCFPLLVLIQLFSLLRLSGLLLSLCVLVFQFLGVYSYSIPSKEIVYLILPCVIFNSFFSKKNLLFIQVLSFTVSLLVIELLNWNKDIFHPNILINVLSFWGITLLLQSNDKDMTKLISQIGHELRTPISGTISIVDHILKDKKIEDINKKRLESIKIQSSSLLSIVNDILDYSRIVNGKMELNKNYIQIQKLIDSISLIMEEEFRKKNNKFTYTSEIPQSVFIESDEVKLGQIFFNLIGNANKFTENGTININFFRKDHETFVFKISDTGIGMTREESKKIFNAYTQANEKTAKTFGGTGLGLTISKKIVEAMKGTITVDSSLDKGTTFTIELPLKTFSTSEIKDNLNSPLKYISSYHKKLKILVVEDNDINAEIVQSNLIELGHSCKWAADGKTAVKMTESENFDLILMDIQMPGWDGFQTTQAIKKDKNQTFPKIFALTAYNTPEDHNKCFQYGMDEVLVKPIDQATLLPKINKHFFKHRYDLNFVPERPKKKIIENNNILNNLLKLNRETSQKIISNFLIQAPKICQEIDEIDPKDREQLKRKIHTLKGLMANFGGAEVTNQCKLLEGPLLDPKVTQEDIKIKIEELLISAYEFIDNIKEFYYTKQAS